jgi:hypothetical protein
MYAPAQVVRNNCVDDESRSWVARDDYSTAGANHVGELIRRY